MLLWIKYSTSLEKEANSLHRKTPACNETDRGFKKPTKVIV